MNLWQMLIPFITAFSGWFAISIVLKSFFRPYKPQKIAGFTWQGIYSKKQKELSEKVARVISNEFLSFKAIEEKITDPASLQQLMPLIETQVDHFLRVKLTETMPYITTFIGEKTINQLKAVFMEELQILFPQLMKNYLLQLQQEYDIEKIIAAKLAGISVERMEMAVNENISRELKKAKMAGGLIGFALGTLYLLVTLVA